jgi:hypothetical protein
MWGWVRAAAIPSMPSRSSGVASSRPIANDERQTVIQLFAAMAMSSTKRRAYERIHQSAVAPSRT